VRRTEVLTLLGHFAATRLFTKLCPPHHTQPSWPAGGVPAQTTSSSPLSCQVLM
jgi:hypothetical protein